MQDVEIIQKAGLSSAQAATYLSLLKNGAMTPADLAKSTGETRTNTYAVLDKLTKAELVKDIGEKTSVYEASHPSVLEAIAEKRRRQVSKNEQVVKANMSTLTDLFYAHSTIPGARVLNGLEGIKEVYDDVIRTGKDVYLIRTTHDHATEQISPKFLSNFRDRLVAKGIHTYGLTPATPHARAHVKEGRDKERLFHRTFMPEGAYQEPVDIKIYGNKAAFTVFTKENEISIIIESPAIAMALKWAVISIQEYYKSSPQYGVQAF
jgi:sugar-specific transcriptional regulator TrmB